MQTSNILSIKDISCIVEMVCSQYPVRRAFLFGSRSRSEHHATSDVDLYIELDDSHPLGGFLVGNLYSDLEDALGEKIDTVFSMSSEREIRKIGLRDSIKRDKVLLYDSQKQ